MKNINPNKQYYCKAVSAFSRIEINSPCEIEIKGVNSYGKINFVFITPRDATVDIYKMKHDKLDEDFNK